MFHEVVGEGVFNHKSGSRERGNSWQNVATTLNAIDGFLFTARAVRDRVINLLQKFSAQNNSEKQLSGEGGAEPTEYDTLLQDLVDLSRESGVKQEQITEQKKALADADKQKYLDIRDMAMKNLKESQQVLRDGPLSEKRPRRSNSDTFSFLREKLEQDKEFRGKELKLKQEERTEFRYVMIQQQRQSNEILRIFKQQSQVHSEQQTMMQQQIHALMVQQQQQIQIFMGLLSKK